MMLGRIPAFFRTRDSLIQAAHGADREFFARSFIESTVYCLFVDERFADGMPANATAEEMLAVMEEALRDFSEMASFEPFTYSRDNRLRLPLFSNMKAVKKFLRYYHEKTQRLIPIQAPSVDGATLVPYINNCELVVLNDASKKEYIFSEQDKKLVVKACGLASRCS